MDALNWLTFFHLTEDSKEVSASDRDTVKMSLNVKCERRPDVDKNETDPEKKYIQSSVYARDMVFHPLGQQAERFKDDPIAPVHPDILIAKLRPGQEISVDLHAIKGVGLDHAKFSPVATASYRLLPTITITKPILGPDAKKFQKCFPKGVIDLERVTPTDAMSDNAAYHGREGDEKVVVKDTFRDTVSRECLRHDEFNGKVKLGRVQDHFIFNVESTGQFPSDELFLESISVLKFKALRIQRALEKLNSS